MVFGMQGAGFVQYALIEDAARAIKELDSTVLLGRTIQVHITV